MDEPAANVPVDFSSTFVESFACPNCYHQGMQRFYSVRDIPVHSCLLISSENEALNFPRGNLSLGFCGSCGFICNMDFDPAMHNYCAKYEETQGFSACFSHWQDDMIRRLIQKYDIRSRNVLEIGCGKGEFLLRLCELGGNRGTGIDPSYVPARTSSPAASQVTFIRDFYPGKYAGLSADVICCRHTLEHIAPTRQFLSQIRAAIGDRKNTLVFFEVPDVRRVLREGAFWDLYYEHCSYFSCGSLAKLFRSCSFDIEELYLDYDGQYIMLIARPADGPVNPSMDIEDDLLEVAGEVAEFSRTCGQRVKAWHDYIRTLANTRRKAAIWGAGSKGVAFLTTLKVSDQIPCVVDVNPFKHHKHMPLTAHQVLSPEKLTEYRPDDVLIMNPIYQDEINKDLQRMGLAARLLPV